MMTTQAASHMTAVLHKASREIKIFTTGGFHISANTGAHSFQRWANPVTELPLCPRGAMLLIGTDFPLIIHLQGICYYIAV